MKHGKNRGDVKGSRDWVLRKKERQRRQGRNVKRDSKYTARRRAGFWFATSLYVAVNS